METLHERKMARARGGHGGIPKYGEISITIKNVSNHQMISSSFESQFHLPALPPTHH